MLLAVAMGRDIGILSRKHTSSRFRRLTNQSPCDPAVCCLLRPVLTVTDDVALGDSRPVGLDDDGKLGWGFRRAPFLCGRAA